MTTDLRVTERSTCRVCDGEELIPLFSLGEQYISNFVTEEEIEGNAKIWGTGIVHPKFIKAPLNLVLCPVCTLVQLKHTAPQELLYSRHYWYRSGVTQTMRDALRDVTAAIEERVDLRPGHLALDIGSNDGTLLRSYSEDLIKIGFEPATNLAEEGANGLDQFVNDFWSFKEYNRRFSGLSKPKVITAIGMFYDLEDPNQFIKDVAETLGYSGVFVAQLMCLQNMLNVGDVGNICHEHIEYYSLKSLNYLFGKHGLEIFDIETTNVNGESYRLWVRHKGFGMHGPNAPNGARERIEQLESLEASLDQVLFYHGFYSMLDNNRQRVRDFIIDANEKCKRVWVYGASTKGNTILQWMGLDNTLIQGAADRSPEKWGKYTIGTNIRIYPESEARAHKPDYFLVLPYSFLPEFIEREKDYDWRTTGGKFIVPLPQLRVV